MTGAHSRPGAEPGHESSKFKFKAQKNPQESSATASCGSMDGVTMVPPGAILGLSCALAWALGD